MGVRRVIVSGVSAALVALALAGCVPNPAGPSLPGWPLALSSPYHGASTPVVDPISGIGRHVAKVRVCSLAGGPVAVDVHSPGATDRTRLTVRIESTRSGDDATLLDAYFPEPTVTVDTHLESNRALEAGECADVTLLSSYGGFVPGDRFTFKVTW